MATNFLGLDLPVVLTTVGPDWANKVNAAFDVIDLHDHSSGKGAPVPTSGLNINASLNFNSNDAYDVLQVKLISNPATLTGSSNVNSIYSVSGDLYYTNSSGSAVQITTGGAVVTSAGALQTVEINDVAGNITISPSDTFVFLSVDTSSARAITLPLASAVVSGRIYIVKDITGSANTNNITVNAAGSDTIDGDASFAYNSNYGSFWIIGNGTDSWRVA